jgi:hypothetical protein
MIEVYVGMTLLGLGYLFNQQKNTRAKANPIKQINKGDLNTQRNVYDSNYMNTLKQLEYNKARAQHQAAVATAKNGITNPQSVTINGQSNKKQQSVIIKDKDAFINSQLTGHKVPASEFVHNNMKPFGIVKQTYGDANSQPLMESFTGTYTYYKPKQEVENIFKPELNVGNMNGTPVQTQFYQDRYEKPKSQNNVLPFQQVRVGPGLNRGYGCKPDGGFQQFDVRDHAMPKTVDELRVGSNPKQTYEGRVVDGQKGNMRGVVGQINKNRVSTFYVNNPDRYFKTTGAYLKPKQQPAPIDKNTNRQSTSVQYQGVAYINKGNVKQGQVQQPHRSQLRAMNIGQANMTDKLDVSKADYGKGNILIYSNERDITSTRTYEGNITSLVKAVIAPLQDLIKITKKEFMINNPTENRPQLQATMPSKQPVYNPNDVARTTVKETLLNESQNLNIRGTTMSTVYDPNNVARTTVKETLLNESQNLNIRGTTMSTVYDPNNVARTTIKETMIDTVPNANIKGPAKQGVYDPNDVARTTLKETMLDSTQNTNIRGQNKQSVHDPNDVVRTTIKETTLEASQTVNVKGPSRAVVYDPNVIARATIKETVLDSSQHLNIHGFKKSQTYDPNDIARTTLKETTLHDTDTLNIRGGVKRTVYDPNDITRTTLKETILHDSDALNIKAGVKTTVYDPNDIARTTIKETLLHNSELTNIKGDKNMGMVYDPDNEAKTTIRETLYPEDTTLNLTINQKKPRVYDPDDIARTTMKETTVEGGRNFGNVDRAENFTGAYENEHDHTIVEDTQRNQYTDEYMGNPNAPNADGYKVTDANPRDTQRQVLSDRDYFGGAQTQGAKAPTSYSDIYNATINSLKEELVVGREPTQSGVKVATGGSDISMETRKQELAINLEDTSYQERIVNIPSQPSSISLTRKPQLYDDHSNILDEDMMKAFNENPYTKSLQSFT